MPTTIAIICTLDELIPYSRADRSNRYFSLHLSVGLKNVAALPDTTAIPLFQPWELTSVTPVIYADAGAPGTAPSGAQIAAGDIVSIDPSPLDPAQIGQIGKWLGNRFAYAMKKPNPAYFTWSDDPDPNLKLPSSPSENWSRILSHASTYMAPIPNNLKLAFHFKISVAKLASNPRLFVAPILVNGAASYKPTNSPDTPSMGYASWQYASAPGTAGMYSLTSYQAEFIPDPLPQVLPKSHFIDLNTFWVGTADGKDQIETPPPEANASEDWRTALEFRAGEEFDLGQRLIVVLRQLFFPPPPPPPAKPPADPYKPINANHPTFSEVDTMKTAVLAALRDTSDLGLRYGPDGTNLLRFVLQRTPSAPDPVPYESALLKAAPMAGNDWATLVTNTTGISTIITATRGANGDPASGDYLRATLDMLDNVQKALATGDILSNAIFQQWDNILATTVNDWSDPNKNIRASVSTELTNLSSSRALRNRMLLANMGGQAQTGTSTDPLHPASPTTPIWSALIATTTGPATTYLSETQNVTANLEGLLQSYFRGRFAITIADANAALFSNRTPQASWPGTASNPSPDLSSALSADAGQFASSVLFPSTANQASPDSQTPAPASHPIIVQVGETSDDPNVSLNKDVERKVAGFGLLIAEGAGAWSSANVANLYVAQFQTTNFQKLLDSLPVPLRLTKRNNLKQPILSYNSASLVNQDASDQSSIDFHSVYQSYPGPSDEDWSQIFQYRLDADQLVGPPTLTTDGQGNFTLTIPPYQAPKDTLQDWKRIPALKFGRTYSLLPFVIGNGGVLPPPLASLNDPFTPVNPSVFKAAWSTANLSGYLRTVTYKRRVAVGAPRLAQSTSNTSATGTVSLPVFPNTVVPLARDIMPRSPNPAPVMLLWGDPTQKSSVTIPSFTFPLRPPSCDLETWDRWVAGLTESAADTQAGRTYRNTRIAVKTAVGQATLKNTDETQPGPGQPTPAAPDLSIDDPAVASLTLSLTPIYPNANLPAPPPLTIALTPPPAIASVINGKSATVVQNLISYVQSNQFSVSCSIGNAVGLSQPANQPISVTVPSGQVWQLTVQSNLNAADVTGKFEGPAAAADGGSSSLIIEAATQGIFAPATPSASLLPFQQSLWNALSVGYDLDTQSLTASIQFWADATPTQRDQARDLMRKVDLRRQDWRWMGRPMPPLPSDWSTPNATQLDADPPAALGGVINSRLWEIASFAERSDDDCAITTTSINFTSGRLTKPTSLLAADLSKDSRAQYFRFGIDAHSRYEGLPGLPLTTIRAQRNNAPPYETAYTRWRRWVKPPAISGTVPKPKVLMAIPLTSPDGSDASTVLPDLLVIANEPWFSLGGLGEELHAELDLARDPSFPLTVPTAQANPIPEIGPNPILSVQGLEDSGVKFVGPPANSQPTVSPIPAQPLGTTFDENTTAPLFGNTCFRLRPSMVWSNAAGQYYGSLPPSGLEHFEAKVRFRRIVRATAFGQQTDLASDLTDPFAVEFQPSFDHCIVTDAKTKATTIEKFTDLSFAIAGGMVQFYLGTSLVNLNAGPPQDPHLELWALVMNLVSDASGQLQEQTFAADLVSLNTATSTADSANVRIFILEVLCTEGNQGTFTSGIPKAAIMLFGDPADPNRLLSDVKAKIQRCSPMISHKAAAS